MKSLMAILGNLLDAIRLGPGFPFRHIAKALGRRRFSVPVKGAGRITIRPGSSDAQTFIDVFRGRAYDIAGWPGFATVMAEYRRITARGDVPLILDLGANVGAASVWFARQFPEARIIAVEPDAENAALCRLNTRALANVTCVTGAIASRSGHVSLRNDGDKAWTIQTAWDPQGQVPAYTIADLVATVGRAGQLFIVKIDIEGFESDLFARGTEWIDEVTVIFIEPHDWMLPGQGTSLNFQEAIGRRRRFEVRISGENLVYVRLPGA